MVCGHVYCRRPGGGAYLETLLSPRGFCLRAVQKTCWVRDTAFRLSGSGCQDGCPPWACLKPPRSLSMGTTCPGDPLSLSHGDELRLTLPLSCLWERSDCLRSQLLQLWCWCRQNFLEMPQGLAIRVPSLGLLQNSWAFVRIRPLCSVSQFTSTSSSQVAPWRPNCSPESGASSSALACQAWAAFWGSAGSGRLGCWMLDGCKKTPGARALLKPASGRWREKACPPTRYPGR